MHSNEDTVQTKLHRIAKKASKNKRCQFTSLFHLMNKSLLLECFTQLKAFVFSKYTACPVNQFQIIY